MHLDSFDFDLSWIEKQIVFDSLFSTLCLVFGFLLAIYR